MKANLKLLFGLHLLDKYSPDSVESYLRHLKKTKWR